MGKSLSKVQIRALAEFRYTLRRFLLQSDTDARLHRIEPQQYLLLLHIIASGGEAELSEQYIAERLGIKHNSVVELVSRAVGAGLVVRGNATSDQRKKNIQMTTKGEKIIKKLIRVRLEELERSGPQLIHALSGVLTTVSRHCHRSIKQKKAV